MRAGRAIVYVLWFEIEFDKICLMICYSYTKYTFLTVWFVSFHYRYFKNLEKILYCILFVKDSFNIKRSKFCQ